MSVVALSEYVTVGTTGKEAMKSIVEKISRFNHCLEDAKKFSQVPIRSQLVDIFRGLMSDRQMGLLDYFDYRLFAQAEYGPDNPASEIAGWKAARVFSDALNAAPWSILADDKISMYSMLQEAGVRVPRTHALYHPRRRLFANTRSLGSRDDIMHFLREEAVYPLFCKPSIGCHGTGAQLFVEYDVNEDAILTHEGDSKAVSAVADAIVLAARGRTEWGYLFQEKIVPHDSLRAVTGDGVSTFRILILAGPDDVVISRVAWRIIVGRGIVDAFYQGKTGNLLGGIDPMTGRVFRVVQGMGVNLKHVESHPLTGETLLGLHIPRWDEIREHCLRAARTVPMLQWQHWDVTLTDDGPVTIELNCEGDPMVLQIGTGRGLMDPAFKAFLASNGRRAA